jgi:hypothetical protein
MFGRYTVGQSDCDLARRIFELCAPATSLIALKQYDVITLFY